MILVARGIHKVSQEAEMAYLADFYALYLARNSNFHSATLYRDSRRPFEPEYAKNAISTTWCDVHILT